MQMNMRRLQQAWKRRVWADLRASWRPEVDVLVGNRIVRVDLRDRIIGRLLYLGEGYETHLDRFIAGANLEGRICVDVGANIGLHTLTLSAAVGPSGKVFSLEPENRNFALLERNLRANAVTNVTAVHCAAGESEGKCELKLSSENFGDHRVAGGTRVGPGGFGIQTVPMCTVDRLLRETGDGEIGFIKIDVQGYEMQVLRGMEQTLRRNRDAILLIEVFPEALRDAGFSPETLVRHLHDLGLSGWEIHPHRLLPCAEPWVYELVARGKYVDLALSGDRARLDQALEYMWGSPLRGRRDEQA
jgi:FkbM family methyltransferase